MIRKQTLHARQKLVSKLALKQIHERIVKIALEKGVAAGRRMRVDTTVVEANIHYPTDSSLLGDGVRVTSNFAPESS